MTSRAKVLGGMVFAAALSRLLPHPPNAAPIAAMALFGGARFPDKRSAFLVPLAAMLASDLLIGVYGMMPVVYLAFALIVCAGFSLRESRGAGKIAAAALASSALFFLVTNFGTWAFEGIYPRTLAGLQACYVAAVPFFRNTLLGDAAYTAALFGGLALIERGFPSIREPGFQPARARI